MRWKLFLLFIIVFLILNVEARTITPPGSRTVTKFEDGSSSKTLEDGDFVYIDVPVTAVLKAFTIDVQGKDNASDVELKIDNKLFLKPNETSFTSLIEDIDLSKNVSISKCDKICRWKLELECDEGEVVVKGLLINYTFTKTPLFIKYIKDVKWDSGTKDSAFDLDDYFYGTDLEYKNRSSKEHTLEHLKVEIASNGEVSFTVEEGWEGTGYIYFRAEDEEYDDQVDSNEIKLIVGSGEDKRPYQFSPSGSNVTLKQGSKQSFGVSGSGNFSVNWYLNGNLKQSGSYTYVFDATNIGTYNLEAKFDTSVRQWTISVLESEVTEPGLPPELEESVCGNGKREVGEDCSNCPEDVKCAPNAECKNGQCVLAEQKMKLGWLIGWLIGFVLVIVLVVVGIILFKKDKLKLPKLSFFNIFKKINIFKKKEKIKKELVEKEEIKKDLIPLKTYLLENLKKGHKKEDLIKATMGQGWTKEQIDKVLAEQVIPTERKEILPKELEPLKNYIIDGIRNGYKREDLVKAAINRGWKKEQVDEVLKRI